MPVYLDNSTSLSASLICRRTFIDAITVKQFENWLLVQTTPAPSQVVWNRKYLVCFLISTSTHYIWIECGLSFIKWSILSESHLAKCQGRPLASLILFLKRDQNVILFHIFRIFNVHRKLIKTPSRGKVKATLETNIKSGSLAQNVQSTICLHFEREHIHKYTYLADSSFIFRRDTSRLDEEKRCIMKTPVIIYFQHEHLHIQDFWPYLDCVKLERTGKLRIDKIIWIINR